MLYWLQIISSRQSSNILNLNLPSFSILKKPSVLLFALFMRTTVGYLLESVHYIIRKHLFKMKYSKISYFSLYFWLTSFLPGSTFTASIDLVLIDSLIAYYAFCASYSDQMLQFLRFREDFFEPN